MLKLNKIHKDSRGSINVLLGKAIAPAPEVTIFETKARYARGGCVHSQSCEHICVISGSITFIYGSEKKIAKLSTGSCLTIPPMTPHYFIADEDSVVMEWGPQLSEKLEKDLVFRSIVEDINKKVSK